MFNKKIKERLNSLEKEVKQLMCKHFNYEYYSYVVPGYDNYTIYRKRCCKCGIEKTMKKKKWYKEQLKRLETVDY